MPDFPTFNPDVAKALPEYTKRSPYASLVGIEILEVGPGTIRARIPVTEKLASGVGAVHGGAIVSIVDHCLSLAVYPLVEIGKWVATLELKVNYLSPARIDRGGEILCEATVLALKKRVAVVRVDVHHDQEMIASAQGTVYVRDALQPKG